MTGNSAYVQYTCTISNSSLRWSGVMLLVIPIDGDIEIYFISESTKQSGRYQMGGMTLKRL